MTIKPILFSTPMVRAISEKRKTQTRRTQGLKLINEDPELWVFDRRIGNQFIFKNKYNKNNQCFLIPKFLEGDILWVRETFRYAHHYGIDYEFVQYKDGSTNTHCEIPDKDQILHDDKWKPSIFMPKAACRIFLEVINVKAERLIDISWLDAVSEGCSGYRPTQDEPTHQFKRLWEFINGKESWKENPWVWVYDFKRVEKPQNF